MASHNLYSTYKRDTSRLIYWLINSYNSVLSLVPDDGDDTRPEPNTSGETTVSGIVSMAEIVAKHCNYIPGSIFSLFQSVIRARTETHEIFLNMVASIPDEEMQLSNHSHKYFIDTLGHAFTILGGNKWLPQSQAAAADAGAELELTDDTAFLNSFAALRVDKSDSEGEEEAEVDAEGEASHVAAKQKRRQNQAKKSSGKRRKGKGKAGKKPARSTKVPEAKKIPLSSYRITDDDGRVSTEYFMAAYSAVQEWAQLRAMVRNIWRNVAYNGLNSAVAGSVSLAATARVKQTAALTFIEFPERDSYETIMKSITRGDPDKAQGFFQVALVYREEGSSTIRPPKTSDINVKEQVLYYAYNDLLDFIVDYQKTRSGKPTKPMMAQIRNWDPNFDIMRADREARLKWRRSYTINWLYDLVNHFSCVVKFHNKHNPVFHALETVDWSVNGPWDHLRRIYGLQEFAGYVTTLAMQKPGTDVRARIYPHHVFQLQCIVDAMTVSRGWYISVLRGDIFELPAQGFRPRRDIDLFLGSKGRTPHGYIQAIEFIMTLPPEDQELYGGLEAKYKLWLELQSQFQWWLGEPCHVFGKDGFPASRFSNTNDNGLWEFSPFLCGAGLMEALDLAYRASMVVWDRMPEPLLFVHLHNMLVKEGYLKAKNTLFGFLENFFTHAFYKDGTIPETGYAEALQRHIAQNVFDRPPLHFRKIKTAFRAASKIEDVMNVSLNRIFTQESSIRVFQRYDWSPEMIPDLEIPTHTQVFGFRLGQVKRTKDPETGIDRFEESKLVNRARSFGMSEKTLLKIASNAKEQVNDSIQSSQDKKDQLFGVGNHDRSTAFQSHLPGHRMASGSQRFLSTNAADIYRDLELHSVKYDVYNEVCGSYATLAFNYIEATARFQEMFMEIEQKLRDLRNPLYFRIYELDRRSWIKSKRVGFVVQVMKRRDEECLKTIAAEFEKLNMSFGDHIYWKMLDLDLSDLTQMSSNKPGENCTVM